MSVLLVGASGATGRRLAKELLARGEDVRAPVRSPAALPSELREHPRLSLVHATLLDLDEKKMTTLVSGCRAIASCLGHTPSVKGVYGHPRRLVTEATRRLCAAAALASAPRPVRFVLMNTAGVRGPEERVSWTERRATALLRRTLPPHADNEDAVGVLRALAEDGAVEWVVVRPDTLHDTPGDTNYEVHASPTRSALLDPGRTSRDNVARFMAALLCEDATWSRWKGRMPVIYDRS